MNGLTTKNTREDSDTADFHRNGKMKAKKTLKGKDFFGALKGWEIDTQKFKDDLRRDEKKSWGRKFGSEKKRKKSNVLKEMFGTAKFKEPTDKMMKEIDKLLYND